MGVEGLWQSVAPAASESSFLKLALQKCGKTGRTQQSYRLGVDASIWFKQCQQVFTYGHAQAGENPELRTLFYRLARLFSLPVTPVFVFDGPERPAVKRGKRVILQDHWLTGSFQNFIEAFGFQWVIAAGEAEAELAHMNKLGLIDAVVTDDSDALVFGAITVIRVLYTRSNRDIVTVYESARIALPTGVGLTNGGLLLFALLSGGDYDQHGLRGCGRQTCLALARYGLGDSLRAAALSCTPPAFLEYLPTWREELCHILRMDPQGYIGYRRMTLADAVPHNFPNPTIIHAYLHPSTTALTTAACHHSRLDLARLAQLCELHFTWGSCKGISEKFHSLIWPGVALKVCMLKTISQDGAAQLYEPQLYHAMRHALDKVKVTRARAVAGIPHSKVELDVAPFTKFVTAALLNIRDQVHSISNVKGEDPAAKFSTRIPSFIFADDSPSSLFATSSTIIVTSPSSKVIDLTMSSEGSADGDYKNDIIDLTVSSDSSRSSEDSEH